MTGMVIIPLTLCQSQFNGIGAIEMNLNLNQPDILISELAGIIGNMIIFQLHKLLLIFF